jgi:hypothetical protein
MRELHRLCSFHVNEYTRYLSWLSERLLTSPGCILPYCNDIFAWPSWLSVTYFHTAFVNPQLKSASRPHCTRGIKSLFPNYEETFSFRMKGEIVGSKRNIEIKND